MMVKYTFKHGLGRTTYEFAVTDDLSNGCSFGTIYRGCQLPRNKSCYVSRRINSLEKVTGQRLLLRSQSGWEITSEGRQIFEIAEEIEQSLTKLIADDAEAAVKI